MNKSATYTMGYYPKLKLQIILHSKDLALLKLLQAELGVGNISVSGTDRALYQITSKKDLCVLFALLDKYPLLTNK
jgi:hypothetical protein